MHHLLIGLWIKNWCNFVSIQLVLLTFLNIFRAKIGIYRLEIKNTNIVLRLKPGAFKKASISITKGEFLRLIGLMVRRPI